MDIFKMANQIASSMSDNDRNAIENMDMEKMLSHVTQNVFKMMNNNVTDSDSPIPNGLMDFMNTFAMKNNNTVVEENSLVIEENIPKTRDIRFDLNVDLSDFYNGKVKKLNIKRKRIVEENGKQKVIEEKKRIVIPIEKGMKDEQEIRFEGEADQIPGYIPGDIIITLVENDHPFFQRDNDNLIIVKNINIYQLYEYSFNITHLDSRVLLIHKHQNDSLHLNESLRKIPGLGMPVYKSQTYGDLFIRFNLNIPRTLESKNIKKLKEIFDVDSEKIIESKHIYMVENVNEEDLDELDSNYFEESDSLSETDIDDTSSVSSVSCDENPSPLPRKKK